MKKFELEIERTEQLTLSQLVGTEIKSAAIPEGHSLTATWLLLLELDGHWLECSAVPRDLGDWQEAGSLRLRLLRQLAPELRSVTWTIAPLSDFQISGVEKLVINDGEFQLESGLVFRSQMDKELWVVCSSAPGSMSVMLPLLGAHGFEPEYPIDEYERVSILAQ
jgi:hypothetical protein